MKQRKKIKTSKIFITIVLIILINTSFIYFFYINVMSLKIEKIVEKKLNNINNYLINSVIGVKSLDYLDIDDTIIVNKNKNDEIIYVDFNLKNSYKMLRRITNDFETKLINNDLSYLKNRENIIKYNDNKLLLDVPVGSLFSNFYMSKMGPKIPVSINLSSSVLTGLNVEVKNYGINNCLIKLYLNITLNEDIYLPVNGKEIKKDLRVLVGSKMIQGQVPNIYGSEITKQSSILSSNK